MQIETHSMFCVVDTCQLGRMGVRSLIGLPNKHMAGESFVSLLVVFRHHCMAFWKLSTSRSPLGPTVMHKENVAGGEK